MLSILLCACQFAADIDLRNLRRFPRTRSMIGIEAIKVPLMLHIRSCGIGSSCYKYVCDRRVIDNIINAILPILRH